MPSTETGVALGFVLLGDTSFVKGSMGRVFEDSSSKTFVVSDSSVADELNLGNTRNGLEVMKNGVFYSCSLVVAMPITLGLRIETLKCCGLTVTKRLGEGNTRKDVGQRSTLVSPCCCSGGRATLRNKRTPYRRDGSLERIYHGRIVGPLTL